MIAVIEMIYKQQKKRGLKIIRRDTDGTRNKLHEIQTRRYMARTWIGW
tara:strand:- start:540 stop:683 length:144 start_codon:yes stop_codon:yes gene_type:complete